MAKIKMFGYKAIRRPPSPFPQRVKSTAPQDAVTTTTRKKQQADVSRKQGSLDGHSSSVHSDGVFWQVQQF
jgi:hypothetical protein